MHKLRYAFMCSWDNIRRWYCTPRIITIAALIVCVTLMYVIPFSNNAKVMEQPLQAAEAFIALMNLRFSYLIFSSVIILLFCDIPVVNQFTPLVLLRGSRRQWISGQILYVIITAALLVAITIIISILPSGINIFFENEWSKPVKLLALSGRIAIPSDVMKMSLDSSIVKTYLPWEAFSLSAVMFFLLTVFYGMASLLLKLIMRSGSVLTLILINLISWMASMFGPGELPFVIISWVSPHYHATLANHYYTNVQPLLPSVLKSMLIMLTLIFLCIILIFSKVKRYNFFNSMEGYNG